MLRSTFSAESSGGSCPGSSRVSSVGEMARAPCKWPEPGNDPKGLGPCGTGQVIGHLDTAGRPHCQVHRLGGDGSLGDPSPEALSQAVIELLHHDKIP